MGITTTGERRRKYAETVEPAPSRWSVGAPADAYYKWTQRADAWALRNLDDRGATVGARCGTDGCDGIARWIPITEGNRGSRVYRCESCCDRVDEISSPGLEVTYTDRTG